MAAIGENSRRFAKPDRLKIAKEVGSRKYRRSARI